MLWIAGDSHLKSWQPHPTPSTNEDVVPLLVFNGGALAMSSYYFGIGWKCHEFELNGSLELLGVQGSLQRGQAVPRGATNGPSKESIAGTH